MDDHHGLLIAPDIAPQWKGGGDERNLIYHQLPHHYTPNQSCIGNTSDNGRRHALSSLQTCGEELLGIPAIAELAQIDQWVAWKAINRKGRQDKVPVNVATNKLASHSDPNTWNSYAAARSLRAEYNGIGFVFSEYDPYSGVDLDGCREPKTGEIAEWAWKWIQDLNSYTEISPSGTGVKIWVHGTLPKNIGKDRSSVGHVGIEAYSHSRYFCVTAQHLPVRLRRLTKLSRFLTSSIGSCVRRSPNLSLGVPSEKPRLVSKRLTI